MNQFGMLEELYNSLTTTKELNTKSNRSNRIYRSNKSKVNNYTKHKNDKNLNKSFVNYLLSI